VLYDAASFAVVRTVICVTLTCVEFASANSHTKVIFQAYENHHGRRYYWRFNHSPEERWRGKEGNCFSSTFKAPQGIAGVSEAGKEVQEKTLEVTLSYENGKHRISGVKRVSKPGRRLYTKVTDIHPVKFGKGHMILSTPAGILTGEEAKQEKVGGEQLFMIW
jgi:ribosomal protein S8